MLTIENKDKILHKPLGKKNFYVERVEQSSTIINPYTFEREEKYIFELTNRKYAITITLGRNSVELHNEDYYKLYSSTGHHSYLRLEQIRNIDKFLDEIRLLAL